MHDNRLVKGDGSAPRNPSVIVSLQACIGMKSYQSDRITAKLCGFKFEGADQESRKTNWAAPKQGSGFLQKVTACNMIKSVSTK